MLWEVEIVPAAGRADREAERLREEAALLGIPDVAVRTAHCYLLEGELDEQTVTALAAPALTDPVVEQFAVHRLPAQRAEHDRQLSVLFKPGVTDNVAETARGRLTDFGLNVSATATARRYWFEESLDAATLERISNRLLANDAIEQVIAGPLTIESLQIGREYRFELKTVPIRGFDDEALARLSKEGQLYLSLEEMRTIRARFVELDRDPTDIELETIAQTWSEHCSHKTLAGRIRYRDEHGERQFENMLKETIFAATQTIRQKLGADDWCVSVFRDNAGVVRFDEQHDVCFKVETHNHPSALEPYGGANTGLGGVIRDPLGTGLGAKPIANTDVFCFASPDFPYDELPPGVLHPRAVMQGVVAGVRDYGNRMGIPTVNGAVYFDDRYLGNPLVYCGNAALLPVGKSEKQVVPGDFIVAIGGRTGRDGIHGATFSSAELTHESETLSGGAVQIGNAITEKMVVDAVLEARDRGLFHAITDCGAGGFSSAVGEMGEDTGAEVWLDRAPLKYAGLSYTEIWISEAQERMVLSVPEDHWDEFHTVCAAEGVEATIIGRFTDTRELVLKYEDREVGRLSMSFLHDGRPPVIREAIYEPPQDGNSSAAPIGVSASASVDCTGTLKAILSSLNVCSKEWIIRQYDHEVQAGSVIKPLVGVQQDGPSDAAVIRPKLDSNRGLVLACGMNPRFGDFDPSSMAASAIDEAVRNCVAVGADPQRIAILDNFCWGNTERPETLGSLVRAAIACHDTAVAFGTPFISGKDSLNNEFSYETAEGTTQTIAIPPSLLISAMGQMDDVGTAVTMDLKQPGNRLYLIGRTAAELGGSHLTLVSDETSLADIPGRDVPPRVNMESAPDVFAAVHSAIGRGHIRSCHDLSEGGLAVALAEMAFAGELGCDIRLDALRDAAEIDDNVVLLFSESNTRFVVEVPEAVAGEFEAEVLEISGQSPVFLGHVTEDPIVTITGADGVPVISAACEELKMAWQTPLAWD